MKISTVLHILLICSLVMLIPPLENGYSTTLFQETPRAFIINVHTPELKISSDKLTSIELNVSYIDPLTNKQTKVTNFIQFTSSETIKTDKPGTYLLEFYTEEIAEITIKGKGIYTYSFIIILTLLILDVALISRNYVLALET